MEQGKGAGLGVQLRAVQAVPSAPQLEEVTNSSWSPICKTEGVTQAQDALPKANYSRSARKLAGTVSFSVRLGNSSRHLTCTPLATEKLVLTPLPPTDAHLGGGGLWGRPENRLLSYPSFIGSIRVMRHRKQQLIIPSYKKLLAPFPRCGVSRPPAAGGSSAPWAGDRRIGHFTSSAPVSLFVKCVSWGEEAVRANCIAGPEARQGNTRKPTEGPECDIRDPPYLRPLVLVPCSFSSIRQLPASSPALLSSPCKLSCKTTQTQNTRVLLQLPEVLAANLSWSPGVTWC